MTDVWPVSLPQKVLVSGYGEGVGDGLLEYQPDTGPPITRARSSASPRPLSMQFELTRAQLATLRTFFDTTLIRGALPFLFPAVIEGGSYLVKFQKQGIPKWVSLGGDYFSVSMTLWVLP